VAGGGDVKEEVDAPLAAGPREEGLGDGFREAAEAVLGEEADRGGGVVAGERCCSPTLEPSSPGGSADALGDVGGGELGRMVGRFWAHGCGSPGQCTSRGGGAWGGEPRVGLDVRVLWGWGSHALAEGGHSVALAYDENGIGAFFVGRGRFVVDDADGLLVIRAAHA
jgi:hypothetical protein